MNPPVDVHGTGRSSPADARLIPRDGVGIEAASQCSKQS